jgi:hypothetical protein
MVARMNDKNDTRWGNWMGRARTCFRAATAIDTSTTAVTSTVRELEAAGADELVVQLREAEAALARAREAVQAALQARKLTPANREVSYGLAS